MGIRNRELMSVMDGMSTIEYASSLADRFCFWSMDASVYSYLEMDGSIVICDREMTDEVSIGEMIRIVSNMEDGFSVYKSVADLGEVYPEPTIDHRDGNCYMTVEAARDDHYADWYIDAYSEYDEYMNDPECIENEHYYRQCFEESCLVFWKEINYFHCDDMYPLPSWDESEMERLRTIRGTLVLLENEQVGSIEEAVRALVDLGWIE